MADIRYEEEQINEAVGVLEQYVNAETLAPSPIVNLQQLIVDKAIAHPRLDAADPGDLELVGRSVRKVLMQRATEALTRFDRGRVCLDLDGAHGRMAWASDVPQVVFCALTSQDTTIHQLVGYKAEAMAVYFDPTLVGRKPVLDRDTRMPQVTSDGEILTKPDQWGSAGYIAIVGAFYTLTQAEEAQSALERAVALIAAPSEGDEDPETQDVPPVGADLTAL